MISNSCVWQQNSPKNGVLAPGWCGIENCCLPNISLNTPAPYPPSLILLASLKLKTFTRPICFHLSRKKSQYYESQQIDIFLKLIPDQFLFSFSIKEISKKSNCNCLAMPPHPHNFSRTICFPAFLPHRDQQAIKCDRESFKVFFTVWCIQRKPIQMSSSNIIWH